jgi:hypothetical protein
MALPSVVVIQAELRSNIDNSKSLHFLIVSYRNLRVSSSAVQSPAEMWGRQMRNFVITGYYHTSNSKPLACQTLYCPTNAHNVKT